MTKLLRTAEFPWRLVAAIAVLFAAFIALAEFNVAMTPLVPFVNVGVLALLGVGVSRPRPEAQQRRPARNQPQRPLSDAHLRLATFPYPATRSPFPVLARLDYGLRVKASSRMRRGPRPPLLRAAAPRAEAEP